MKVFLIDKEYILFPESTEGLEKWNDWSVTCHRTHKCSIQGEYTKCVINLVYMLVVCCLPWECRIWWSWTETIMPNLSGTCFPAVFPESWGVGVHCSCFSSFFHFIFTVKKIRLAVKTAEKQTKKQTKEQLKNSWKQLPWASLFTLKGFLVVSKMSVWGRPRELWCPSYKGLWNEQKMQLNVCACMHASK